MPEAFICAYRRTPIGRFGGVLSSVRPDDLAAVVLRALVAENGGVDWAAVERFKPYGGIRIEDDVVCTNDAPINLTREVWKEIA